MMTSRPSNPPMSFYPPPTHPSLRKTAAETWGDDEDDDGDDDNDYGGDDNDDGGGDDFIF